MKYKKTYLKNKIINYISLNGNKETSEKLLLQTFKELQKNLLKRSDKLMNIALILSKPVFRTYKRINKRRKKKIRKIPAIIRYKKTRISLSMKFILTALKKNQIKCFYKKLYKEIILNIHNESSTIQIKNTIQEEALLKKHFFYYYR